MSDDPEVVDDNVEDASSQEDQVAVIESSYHEEREALEEEYAANLKQAHSEYVKKVEALAQKRADAYAALNGSDGQ